MNANLLPQTPTIKDSLSDASDRLSAVGIPSASLDAELILAHVLQKDRTYLHAHDDQLIDDESVTVAEKYLSERLNRVPIAYIVGYKEFYGRDFIVTPATLIPRAESEDIITILKSLIYNPKSTFHLIDIGTGNGCLGITAKLEFPFLEVTLTDISEKALSVAKQNAKKYKVNVNYFMGDLLKNYQKKPDIIIANLPYVDSSWERSPETNFEPDTALFADNHGLSINKQLIVQASNVLTKDGYLIIEADPDQHSHLIEYAKKHNLIFSHKLNYIITFELKSSDLQ